MPPIEKMYQAYRRIFARCGLNFRAVEADTGQHRRLSSQPNSGAGPITGEVAIVRGSACEYAGHRKAECRPPGWLAALRPTVGAGPTPDRSDQ